MLTTHQLFHLNAVLAEAQQTRNLTSEDKTKWMEAKQIKSSEYNNYLDDVVKDVVDIKKSGVFPIENPSDIHDYIEKDTKESFKNG